MADDFDVRIFLRLSADLELRWPGHCSRGLVHHSLEECLAVLVSVADENHFFEFATVDAESFFNPVWGQLRGLIDFWKK